MFLLLAVLVAAINGDVINQESDPIGLVEGDIKLSRSQLAQLSEPEPESREKRQIGRYRLRWPNAIVHYAFDNDTISAKKRDQILAGMTHISTRTCVKFEPVEDKTLPYIVFIDDGACYGTLGMSDEEIPQITSISDGCTAIGNAIHEIMHSLGIYHTHTRTDRDKYVTVNYEGVQNPFSYEIRDDAYETTPYEYGSTMHYDFSSFSSAVIVPKQMEYLYTMGIRKPSFYDMVKINNNYECAMRCEKKLMCANGGYTNPSNCSECVCPLGYGGVLCDGVPVNASILEATTSWQNYSLTISGLPDGQNAVFVEKIAVIKAPEDKTIQVEIAEMKGVYDDYSCWLNGVEIKYLGDPRIVNPLHCSPANVSLVYTGKLNPMPVVLYKRDGGSTTFGFRYKYLDVSLSSHKKGTNGYDDYEYYL